MGDFSQGLFQEVIDSNKNYFEEYLELVKGKIDERVRLLEIENEKIKKLPVPERDEDGYQYDHNEYVNDLAYEVGELEQLLYRSFVLSVFIFMEDLASQLCVHVQSRTEQAFSYKDIKGVGVGRSLTYLKRVLKKPFPTNSLT